MKNKIKEIAGSAWVFIQAVAALVFVAFIFFLILFLGITAVAGALWCFDYLFLGGVIFG